MKQTPIHPKSSIRAPQSARGGATLSEALVALAIMAIGVISLCSLFPIAVLKTARANQLTNATNIRLNAESMMKVYPWIFADPDPNDTFPNPGGDNNPLNDYVSFASGQVFLFDPQALAPGRPLAMPSKLGLLPRYSGGFSGTAAAADSICSGPDTWSILHEDSIPPLSVLTEITVNNLNNIILPPLAPLAGGVDLRVQLFYNGGKSSLSRMVCQIGAGNTLIFAENTDRNGNGVLDSHALPATITFETARVEARERRYSWLLTVKPNPSSFTGGQGAKPIYDVWVVVFFGRSFNPQDELVYGTVPNGAPNLAPSSTVDTPNPRQIVVTWQAGGIEPNLKRGGFVVDAENGNWYQIENYTDPSGGTTSTVTVTTNLTEKFHLAAFPRGVVDVFPIGPHSPP
ncbi:MAG: hypothetical protein V4719_11775 [Planctomycetota bacterium]